MINTIFMSGLDSADYHEKQLRKYGITKISESIWDSDESGKNTHRYYKVLKPITVYNAGVLISQYAINVSFAFNGYTYYFMHNLAEEDKNCPERTFGYGYNYSYTAGEHELPIKIKLTEPAGFELELGLIPVPQELVKDQTDKKITISSTQSDDLNYIYSFDRLSPDAITYLPIGTIPCSQYELSAPEDIQSGYWPKQVRGVPTKGAVFDGKSKRILPEDADVTVGKEYYLMYWSILTFGKTTLMSKQKMWISRCWIRMVRHLIVEYGISCQWIALLRSKRLMMEAY